MKSKIAQEYDYTAELQYFMQVSMVFLNDVFSFVGAPISSHDPSPSRLVHSEPSIPSTVRYEALRT